MRRFKRTLSIAGVGLALSTALIGFAHTRAGRPLLNALRGAPGCPVNLDGADPKEVEAFRQTKLASRVGSELPASRPALDFELGKTTRGDVERWVKRAHANCESIHENSVTSCKSVAASGPRIDDLHLQFDAANRLVAVDLFRSGAPAVSSQYYDELSASLTRRVGPPSKTSGISSPAYLSAARFRRAAESYRYRDYVAEVSVMNYGSERGVLVREQYQWLPSS